MQKLQNRTARIILFKGYDRRSVDILEELNILEQFILREKHLSLMVYNALTCMHGYLRELFIKCSDHIPYRSRLRNSEINLAMTRALRTEYLKASFLYRGVQIWNSLQHDLKSPQSPKINCHYGRIVTECFGYVNNLFLFIKFNNRSINFIKFNNNRLIDRSID